MGFLSFWLDPFFPHAPAKLYASRWDAEERYHLTLDPLGEKEKRVCHHRVVLSSSPEGSRDPHPTSLILLTSVVSTCPTGNVAPGGLQSKSWDMWL